MTDEVKTEKMKKDNQEKQETAATDTAQRKDVQPEADKAVEQPAGLTLQMIKDSAREDDPKPSPSLTLRKILGGDILTADLVRRQIWLILLIFAFTIVYVAFRYQCQQDLILMDKLETELKDAKYKALSSSSTLTEKCRESRILELLKDNNDSTLQISDQPPYIIPVPDDHE